MYMESSGSRRYSGKLFQMVRPATANERGPYVDNLTGGTISWLLCDDCDYPITCYISNPHVSKLRTLSNTVEVC